MTTARSDMINQTRITMPQTKVEIEERLTIKEKKVTSPQSKITLGKKVIAKIYCTQDINSYGGTDVDGNSSVAGYVKELNKIKWKDEENWIAGHLLNGDLGGDGVSENLVPLTSQANSIHKGWCEQKLKELLTTSTWHNSGFGVIYTVEAIYNSVASIYT